MDLAQEPDFALGELLISPSSCRVRAAGREQRVEPRVMQVLVVLARQAGHTVTREQLIESCWDGRIVSDDAITRVVAQVRNLARSIEPAPFVLETVPKVGFRLIAPGTGEAGVSTSRWRRRGFALTLAGIAVLIVVVGASATWWFTVPGGGRPPGQNSRVDVMQFEPRQPDPALQRLASVVSESVVRMLARNGVESAQRPLPRDDARGGNAELRVAGSVDREGEAYVVNAQILDRRSGLVLWSGRVERPAQAATGLPEEAAANIAALLQCALEDRKVSRAPMELAVFGLYLSACDAVFGLGTAGAPDRMLVTTRRLAKAAPRVAGAHAMHGIAAAFVASGIDHSPEAMNALRAEARAAAERALKLDPRTAKAYVALGLSQGAGANWDVRERDFQRAMAIDPDLPLAVLPYSDLLREVGRSNRAIEISTPVNADPRVAGTYVPLALMLAARGDLKDAEAELARRDDTGAARWTIAVWWEDPATALAKVRALRQEAPNPAGVSCIERYLSELPARKAAGTRGLPAHCARMDPDWRIRLLAREGDLDGAYAAIAQPQPNSRRATNLLFYPEMRAFRADPRFMPLAKRLGLVDYWVKSNHWPDFCAEPGLPYDCRVAARALVS